MIYLQTTLKARQFFGLGRAALEPPGLTDSALGNWALNVVTIGGRRALLFMSERSLLSFPFMIGKKELTRDSIPCLLDFGARSLAERMDAPQKAVAQLRKDLDQVFLCKAENKSLLALFNSLAADYATRVDLGEDLEDVVNRVNMTPRSTLGWKTSLGVCNEILQASNA